MTVESSDGEPLTKELSVDIIPASNGGHATPSNQKADEDALPASPTQSIHPVEVVIPRPSRIMSSSPEAENPHMMVIGSLRAQISDLYSQVTQLNNKLVQSYDRVSDLEDSLHYSSSSLRASTLKIAELELERSQHLDALNNGLLVEKSHVTAELSRLMEKATEEAAQRGQAESARAAIEQDLDDLSATLFHQANSMVAEARIDKAKSERKVDESHRALRGAEEAVAIMQQAMQSLRDDKERLEREVAEVRELIGKGKWVERRESSPLSNAPRLLASHLPYQEFLSFIVHLRAIRPMSREPPLMATFLPLPFIARLLAEDSDPTLRLDNAPSLNWLTRRSVLAAVHQGQLTIEPMHIASLFLESTTSTSPTTLTGVNCALCGQVVYSLPHSDVLQASGQVGHQPHHSWSTSRFLKNPLGVSLPGTMSSSSTSLPSQSRPPSPAPYSLQTVIYVFRLSLPPPQKPSSPYPLCHGGWCLARLRTTCELWRFLRQNIIDKLWEEPAPPPPPKTIAVPPTLPPRKSKVGTLWGLGLNALGMEKTSTTTSPEEEKALPPPTAKVATAMVSAPPLPPRRRIAPDPPVNGHVFDANKSASEPGTAPKDEKIDKSSPRSPTLITTLITPKHPEQTVSVLSKEPISPTRVALPDSCPPSPHTRSLSPPVAAATSSSRTGSPAPPPLPRRAAGRPKTAPSQTIPSPQDSPKPSSPSIATGLPSSPTTKRKSLTRPLSMHAPALPSMPESVANGKPPVAGSVAGVPETAQGSTPELIRRKTPLPSERGKTPIPLPTLDESSRVYVGDVGWEEKVWRELVRLREDMFWARIGGVR